MNSPKQIHLRGLNSLSTNTKAACWICGRPGAKPERTLLGFKKPVCPPGKGCSSRQINR